jgi:hypothetical protein
MHGGLSPDLRNLGQISEIQRPTDIPDSGRKLLIFKLYVRAIM